MAATNMPFVPADDADDDVTPETTTKETAATLDANDRDAMMKAAEEAMRDGAEDEDPLKKTDEEKTRDEQGRFKPTAKPKAEKPRDEKPSSTIARELAKREAQREEQVAYKGKMAEADQVLSKARQALDSITNREQQVAQKEQEIGSFLRDMQKDPMQALKRVGWTAEQFIDNATRSRDPNYQEVLQLREELSKRDQAAQTLAQRLERLETKAKEYDNQGTKQAADREVQAFWAAIPEDSPILKNDRYEDQDDIIAHARKVRQQYYNKTGKVASPEKIVEYLHYLATEKLTGRPQETSGRKPKAGEIKAKVTRALGSSDAAERRGGTAKHIHDMTPDEERQYLVDVANSAIAGDDD